MSVSMELVNNLCDTKDCNSKAKWNVKVNGITVGEYCGRHADRAAAANAKPPLPPTKGKKPLPPQPDSGASQEL